MGPIKTQADSVMTLFRSRRTAVHLVTVLEEMPVQETTDGIAQLREARPSGRRGRGQPWCARATSTTTTCAAVRAGSVTKRRSRPT